MRRMKMLRQEPAATADQNTYKVNWYRVPLPKETLAELNQRSNALGLLQAGGFMLTFLATAALCVWLWMIGQYWLLVPALFLHGTVMAFLSNAVHELVHGTVFRSEWLNKVFVTFFRSLVGKTTLHSGPVTKSITCIPCMTHRTLRRRCRKWCPQSSGCLQLLKYGQFTGPIATR